MHPAVFPRNNERYFILLPDFGTVELLVNFFMCQQVLHSSSMLWLQRPVHRILPTLQLLHEVTFLPAPYKDK